MSAPRPIARPLALAVLLLGASACPRRSAPPPDADPNVQLHVEHAIGAPVVDIRREPDAGTTRIRSDRRTRFAHSTMGARFDPRVRRGAVLHRPRDTRAPRSRRGPRTPRAAPARSSTRRWARPARSGRCPSRARRPRTLRRPDRARSGTSPAARTTRWPRWSPRGWRRPGGASSARGPSTWGTMSRRRRSGRWPRRRAAHTTPGWCHSGRARESGSQGGLAATVAAGVGVSSVHGLQRPNASPTRSRMRVRVRRLAVVTLATIIGGAVVVVINRWGPSRGVEPSPGRCRRGGVNRVRTLAVRPGAADAPRP